MTKYKRITVTVKVDYLIPFNDRTGTSLDGRSIADIAEEFFDTYPLHQAHATRDSSLVNGSQEVIKVEVDNTIIELD